MPSETKHMTPQKYLVQLQTIQASQLVAFCADTGGDALIYNAREQVSKIHAGLAPTMVKNPPQHVA